MIQKVEPRGGPEAVNLNTVLFSETDLTCYKKTCLFLFILRPAIQLHSAEVRPAISHMNLPHDQ